MHPMRPLLLLVCLLLGACVNRAAKPSPAPASQAARGASAPAAADPTLTTASSAPITPSTAQTGQDAQTETVTEADYTALYGTSTVQAETQSQASGTAPAYDPWERYNRKMHRFNMAVDRTVARPLANTYTKVVPATMRLGVTNFFSNLGSPLTMFNQLLQGHPVFALQTLGRFVLNTTLGVAGLLDPASAAGIPRRSGDFGQTLGVWGWRNSRYFELPFFGPRTVRDTLGLVGDAPLSLLRQVEEDRLRFGLQGLQLVDIRARLMSLDALRDQAPDEYALTRDAWLQRRNYQIMQDLRSYRKQDNALPDYLREDKNSTVPADAIPIPHWNR